MKYMGSKDKISMEIKSFIDLNRTSLNQTYIEPFCGGCNMIDKMKGKRIASDNNKYLIAMWQGLQLDLSRPKQINKQMYENAKTDFKNGSNEFYNDFLIGWIGFMASFNGKFFNGYASNENRDYIDESIRNIETQIKHLLDVEFYYQDYNSLLIPNNSIIYCDIPYINSTDYVINSFNYNSFYEYAEQKNNEGHKIFISEYWMPEDRFLKIWSKSVQTGVTLKSSKRVESLFIPIKQNIKQYSTLF